METIDKAQLVYSWAGLYWDFLTLELHESEARLSIVVGYIFAVTESLPLEEFSNNQLQEEPLLIFGQNSGFL